MPTGSLPIMCIFSPISMYSLMSSECVKTGRGKELCISHMVDVLS